jgi:uncharacterized protein (TIGR00725 family)
MTIGVFGSWRAAEGDPIYSLAVEYGRALAAAGQSVLTGGYSGVMEAACRGASEAGGTTIGVTCPEIDRLLPVNRWVTEEIKAKDLQERLATSLRRIDAAIFFPGRTGTITELAFALELREKGILRYPLFLPCDYWDGFLHAHAAVNKQLPYPALDFPGGMLFMHCSTPANALSRLGTAQ